MRGEGGPHAGGRCLGRADLLLRSRLQGPARVGVNANETLLFHALKKRYPEEQYALLAQVRNGTGFSRVTRTADAIAMGLWPSRGLHMHGFEFKCSRADWLNELKQPEKAEEIGKFCHFWWIVVSSKEFVRVDEVPPNWGLLVNTGRGLRAEKAAPERPAKDPSVAFLASVLRSAGRVFTTDVALEAALAKARQEGREEGEKSARANLNLEISEASRDRKAIEDFEKAAGVRITRWDGGRVGEAVKAVMNGGTKPLMASLQQIQAQAEHLSARASAALAEIEAVENQADTCVPVGE